MVALEIIKAIGKRIMGHRFMGMTKLYDEASKSGINPVDSLALLEFYLNQTELVVDESIFPKISAEDFVEIYDRSAIQLFRTYNIFDFCSFSQDDILNKPMEQLYSRDNFYNRLLFKTAMRIFNRKAEIEVNFCPSHLVYENKKDPSIVEMSYKFMAPVYNKIGNVVAVIVVENLRLIKKGIKAPNLTMPPSETLLN